MGGGGYLFNTNTNMQGLSVITVSPISKILQKLKMFLYHAVILTLFY